MFTLSEMQRILKQLIEILEWDEKSISLENISLAFDYTCNDGELCIDRSVTEEEKQQFLTWYCEV